MFVLVRRGPVVMVRMIVADVLVYVQQRARGRRCDQGVGEHESDEPAHEDSLLRALRTLETGGPAVVMVIDGVASGQKPLPSRSPPSVFQ
jgi:hypothetical protein